MLNESESVTGKMIVTVNLHHHRQRKVQHAKGAKCNKFCSQQLNHNLVQLPQPEAIFITTCVTLIVKTFCKTSYKRNMELKKNSFGRSSDCHCEFIIY